jgi:thioredoxin 1
MKERAAMLHGSVQIESAPGRGTTVRLEIPIENRTVAGSKLANTPRKKIAHMKPILDINEADFEIEVLKSKQPVLVNFWADWSQPCRRLGPVLEEVAAACNGRAKVVKVNADNNPQLGMSYWIQSIPTLLFFIHGETRARFVGTASKEAILAKLESLTETMPAIPEPNCPTPKSES